jgi:hypothetical protein
LRISLSRAGVTADILGNEPRFESMLKHDPARELEMSERSRQAIDRETRLPQVELHRRFIQARNQARSSTTDSLLRRIAATLSPD